MTETRKRAVIVSSFNDAGTGKNYVAGSTRMIAAGAFANYEAAGLVREPAPRQVRPKASTRSKAKAKPPAALPPTIPAEPAAPALGEDRPSA
ncbi:MAG TPA: hypothetical protein VGB57_01830 [Allosphingosinicella sp.]|jgi:hypothetical protein